MTDTGNPPPNGLGKLSAPPFALAITNIIAWGFQQYGHPIPSDILMDLSMILSMALVFVTPHNLFQKKDTQ